MTVIAPALALGFVIAHQIAYGSADAAAVDVQHRLRGLRRGRRADRRPLSAQPGRLAVLRRRGRLRRRRLRRRLRRSPDNPGSTALAVLNTATGPSTLVILALALMLFPTGRFLSAGLAPRGARADRAQRRRCRSCSCSSRARWPTRRPSSTRSASTRRRGCCTRSRIVGSVVVVATVLIAVAADDRALPRRPRARAPAAEVARAAWLGGLGLLALLLVLAQLDEPRDRHRARWWPA